MLAELDAEIEKKLIARVTIKNSGDWIEPDALLRWARLKKFTSVVSFTENETTFAIGITNKKEREITC